MYHSITIGGRNLYSDFYLVPDGQVSIAPPPVKKNTVEVPGANGVLDLTEFLTNAPTYGNRTGEILFHVLNDKPITWQTLYANLLNHLHGRRLQMVLEDDPGYYYEGRFSLKEPTHNNDGTWTDISIEYDLDPFKYSRSNNNYTMLLSPEPTRSTKGLTKGAAPTVSSAFFDFQDDSIGRMPVVPEFEVTDISDDGITITANNEEMGIVNLKKHITETGTYKYHDIVLSRISPTNSCSIDISGNGSVSMSFRKGEL